MSSRISPFRGPRTHWEAISRGAIQQQLWFQVRRRDENMWQPPSGWHCYMEDTLALSSSSVTPPEQPGMQS
jgi:hypothetical protein